LSQSHFTPNNVKNQLLGRASAPGVICFPVQIMDAFAEATRYIQAHQSVSTMTTPANEASQTIERRIIELREEHRDLDLAIDALLATPLHDQLQLRRLKKRKLLLKDQISFLEAQLTPDIPA
jgi:hypothetical protein